jgi:indoleamine 2,3-dioxygenase
MDKLLSCLEDYDVSETLGFLPSSLLSSLPSRYYSPWELAAAKLRNLPKGATIREDILCMPLLETKNLVNEDAWRRAYVILGYLSNAFLFASNPPEKVRIPQFCLQPILINTTYRSSHFVWPSQ